MNGDSLPRCTRPRGGRPAARPRAVRGALLAVALLALASALPAAAQARVGASSRATLQECLTSTQQIERSATFAGEMTSMPGVSRMQIRIDVLERLPEESTYHVVAAPGLGVWRSSAPGVKIFKYLKQVTNLSAPAFYKAVVRFRWLGSHGRLIDASQLRTRRCEQPAPPPQEPPSPVVAGTS